MKKLHLLKRTLLLLALIVGCVSYGWATDPSWTHSFASPEAISNNSITVNGATWTVATTSGAGSPTISTGSYSSTYGLKFGSSKSVYFGSVTFSTNYFNNYNVKSVTVNILNNGKKTGTLTAQQGNTSIGSTSQEFGQAWTTLTVNTNSGSGGALSFTYSVDQAFYIHSITVVYDDAPGYTINAQSNNNTYGTVSLTGTTITASPKSGYRVKNGDTGYTVTEGTATVAHEGYSNTLTVTPTSNCTVQVNFEAIPTYTVTFNAEGGSCGTESATETIGGAGVTLPTATTGVAGWEFIGWASDAFDNTTTLPTLYKAGSTYYPTSATTLHAVYTLSETGYAYTRVTSASQIAFAKKIAVASSRSTSRILNHSATTVTAPTETTGEITLSSDQMFALSGDNTTGYVLTGASGTLSQETLSTSGDNDRPIDWSGTNNKWIVEVNTNADNLFALRNAASDKAALEFDSGWKTYYVGTYTSSPYTAMKLYIPKTAYNSNPSAIITPTVAFDSTDPVTLYLDGTTTNTNIATVTGVSKTISYTSSNTSVATVTSEGVVTAVGVGTATITASVDAELGVSGSASDTYNVTVKSATTIAGLKTLYDAAQNPAKAFVADLTDAVVIYVNGSHAYIQDATGAIYASCGSSLTAGNKINGAVSGTITAPYKIDEIKTIDLSAATVTEDGVIPTALTKTVAEVSANAASLDGQLVTINAVTVDKPSTTTTLKDGSKIAEEDATIIMYSPNSGASVNDKEKGNFTGFVSLYNGNTPRINLYEQSQFVKTHNAPTAQTLSFEGGDEAFDEVTSALSAFTGKSVEGAHTAVTYSKVDASSIIGDFNTETGALTLNGACGTATITASAAAGEVVEAGVTTPYLAASESYTITVSPRYMVTFSVNDVETVLRQATSGASIDVPTPSDFGDYKFMGWSTSTVDPTDVEPSMTDLGATVTPENNNGKYYAVYAQEGISGSGGSYTLDYANESDIYNKDLAYATETNLTASDGGKWVIHAYSQKNSTYGLQINTSRSASIKVPTCPSNITSIEVTCKSGAVKGVGFSSTASGSSVISVSDGTSQTLNLTGKKMTDGYIIPVNGNAIVTYIVVNYGPIITYSDYRTSLPTVEVTITDAQYATFCYARELNVEGTGVTAYTASANGEGNAVTLNKISDNIIPANTGVILFAETAGNYAINVSDKGKEAIAGNELVGVTTRTSIPETSADKYNYIFSKKDDVIGFYRASGAYLLPNRAYLSTSTKEAAAREFMAIMFDEGETTSLREVRGLKSDVRGEFYNLNGQRVATPVKGNIYIVNGKKVMFK